MKSAYAVVIVAIMTMLFGCSGGGGGASAGTPAAGKILDSIRIQAADNPRLAIGVICSLVLPAFIRIKRTRC